MGPEVHDLFLDVRALVGSAAISGHGVSYPAVGVASGSDLVNGAGALLGIGFLGEYSDSVSDGRKDTEAQIRTLHSICPRTRFILAGYSQGAQAVGDALQKMDSGLRKLVATAAFFGDPYFNPGSWSARSSFDTNSYGLLGVRGEWPESLHNKVFSYCHFHDIICNVSEKHFGGVLVRNYSDRAARTVAHVTPAYRSVAQGGWGDADRAARDVVRALGVPLPPEVYTGALDIAFVIDSTGSMSDEIDEVKDGVTSLVNQIAAVNSNFQVALVDYKDEPDEDSDYQSRLDTTFTADIATFDRSLSNLEAEGGGDEAESVYSGLMTALNLDWRAGARKLVIQIGDAPAKDPEPVTGYTLHDVQAKALAVDPATIDPIQSGDDEDTATSFSAIASATGGTYLQIPEENPEALVPSIVNDVQRNAVAPAPAINVPSFAIAGRKLVFSAGASSTTGEPIVAYEWDFNGDGIFESTTTDPVATYTFPGPFSGSVVLRARSASGLIGLATAPILVGAPPARVPGRPTKLRGALHHHRLVLSWRSKPGARPLWFTIFGRHRKAVAHVSAADLLAKGARHAYKVTIPGLRSGRTYRYWVAAGNEAGESGKAGPITKRLPRKRHRRR